MTTKKPRKPKVVKPSKRLLKSLEQLREQGVPFRKLSELTPWVDNPRVNLPNVPYVLDLMQTFGWTNPVLYRRADGELEAGHTRCLVAHRLGLEEVPAIALEHDRREAHVYAIADNRSNELSLWSEKLPEVMATLTAEDRVLAGFRTDEEVQRVVGVLAHERALTHYERPQVVEDEPVAPRPNPTTRRGDVWLLGRHRLVCGDSTDPQTIDLALDGMTQPRLVLTDPPYGLNYVSKTDPNLVVFNDSPETLEPLLRAAFTHAADVCEEGAVWYVFSPPGPLSLTFQGLLVSMGIARQTLIWVKDALVLGHSDFHYQHEPFFYGWKPGAGHRQPPDRKQTSVWAFPKPKHSDIHPTMKPVGLMAHAIALSSQSDDVILEPFAGSGTTLIAAEQLGRVCAAVEFDPGYCDAIVARWEALTGQKAQRLEV